MEKETVLKIWETWSSLNTESYRISFCEFLARIYKILEEIKEESEVVLEL